jgi:hypothetical protein
MAEADKSQQLLGPLGEREKRDLDARLRIKKWQSANLRVAGL